MSNIYRRQDKATVCTGKVCVTVYDKTAEFINALIITTVLVVAISVVVKALR
jgi:hypothetical protein